MALPWMNNNKKQVAGLIVEMRKPDGSLQEESSQDSEQNPGLSEAARALLRAFKAEDAAGIAEALKDAFAILDSQPHEEGEHLSEDGTQ